MTRFLSKAQLFYPAAGLSNQHAQTIVSNVMRTGRGVSFRRHRLATIDDDFIDLDFADVDTQPWADLPPSAPIVLHLHGLEGSARRGYACESYRQLARRGICSVGMNFRSCSGVLNHTARFYHAGATADVVAVYTYLEKTFPGRPKGIIGFSLGANMLLKLLGEWGANAPESLRAAVAISPPFDMVLSSRRLVRGAGFWYGRLFLKSLQQKVAAKRHLLGDRLDLARVLRARDLVEFDEYGTVPLHGFLNAKDYYRRNSSRGFIGAISRPTLIIRAQDDPLMDPADIPYDQIASHPELTALFPSRGGHLGFTGGGLRGGLRFWAEARAADFLSPYLQPDPDLLPSTGMPGKIYGQEGHSRQT